MQDKVIKLLAEQLNIKPEKIDLDSHILNDLGADSLDVVELLMTLEDEFGVVVDDEKTASIKTVRDILDIIKDYQ